MRRLLVGLAIASIAALLPCGVHADDQQIAQQIVQQLQQQKADGSLTGFGIDLEVESGIVWLKGYVASREQQTQVLEMARRVQGVEQVVNDLQIKTTAAEPKSQSSVKPALLRSESSSKLLHKPGELFSNLRGSVQRAFGGEKEVAAEPKVAQADMKVAEPTPAKPREAAPAKVQAAPVSQTKQVAPTDEQLAEEIIGKLRSQKDRGALRDFNVDVQVNQGVVWVSGRVSSDTQQTLVLDVARRVRGVKQVVNDLQVSNNAPVQVVSAPMSQLAPVTAEPAPIGTAVAPSQAPVPMQYMQVQPMQVQRAPLAFAPAQSVAYNQPMMMGQPVAEVPANAGVARARFDNPSMPGYAWPSYAAYPNYGAVTYPRQYSPTAWPYIGPFYPYPQVPLGWRKVTLEWDDGWWMLDFKSK